MIFKVKKDNNHFEKKYNEFLNNLDTEYEKKVAKNLIEKIAIWYELRYPDYIIDELLDPQNNNGKEFVNEVMFKNNQYVNTLLDDNSDIKNLDWDEFYNTHTFISTLNPSEKDFFNTNNINRRDYLTLCIHFGSSGTGFPFKVNRLGYIYTLGNVSKLSEYLNDIVNIDGLYIKEIFNYIEKFNKNHENVSLSIGSRDTAKIKEKMNRITRKEELLDCAMYKIISRRDIEVPHIGAYRAFLFAKEFDRDINIPIKYAFNESYINGEKIKFIKEFIKCGGSQDINYYYGDDYNKEVPLSKIIDTVYKLEEEKQIKKEKQQLYNLRERLVCALQTKVENNATKEEKKIIIKLEKKKLKK